MTAASYLAFLGLAALLALTPGPDSLLVLRFSVRRVSGGIAAAIGCSISTLAWAALVGFGLAAIIEQSAEVYRVLKVAGGLYLVFLGVQAIRHSRRQPADAASEPRSFGRSLFGRDGLGSAFASGLLSTITNPKVGLFFLAIVPQFLPNGGTTFGTTMLLGATVAVVGLLYLFLLAAIAARATAWLKRPRVTKYIERISGSILAALGIGTAATAFEG